MKMHFSSLKHSAPYLIYVDVDASNGREYHSGHNITTDTDPASHTACYLSGHAMLLYLKVVQRPTSIHDLA